MGEKLPAVILFSHGSVLAGAGKRLREHAAALSAMGKFLCVEVGYLNYSEPPIETAVKKCLAAGASDLIIVPYFLVAGKFVLEDLPGRINSIMADNPHVKFHVTRAIEDNPIMGEIVLELAETRLPESQRCGLLLALHGSPRAQANGPAVAIVSQIAMTKKFEFVEVGYLECNDPDITTAIHDAFIAGVESLVIVPYFLHTGKHVKEDIPELIEHGRTEYPEMNIHLTHSVGDSDRLVNVLLDRIEDVRR